MKLFKKEIIKSIKLYLKDLSEVYEIDENDFYNLYLNKYLKRNKKTTAYMMFVKNMHKEYDQEKKEKINFVDKAKLIGTKWGNLTEQEKEVYKATGELPENNYHSKMADLRKNDHLDLAKNVSTEDTSSIEKRDHSDIQTDNDNKDQEKNKRGRNEE